MTVAAATMLTFLAPAHGSMTAPTPPDDPPLPLPAGTTVTVIDAAVLPTIALSTGRDEHTDAGDPGGSHDEAAPGLIASYFPTSDFSGPATLERVEPTITHRDDPGIGSVRWSGTLTAPTAGTYALSFSGTGTTRLYLDGELAIESESSGAASSEPTSSGTASSEAEPPTISVDLEAGEARAVVVEHVPERRTEVRATPDQTTPDDASPDQAPVPEQHVVLSWRPPAPVVTDLLSASAETAGTADVAVVLVRTETGSVTTGRSGVMSGPSGATSGPGSSATGPEHPVVPPEQIELVHRVAAANPRTVVVLVGPDDVPTDAWQDDVLATVRLPEPGRLATLNDLLLAPDTPTDGGDAPANTAPGSPGGAAAPPLGATPRPRTATPRSRRTVPRSRTRARKPPRRPPTPPVTHRLRSWSACPTTVRSPSGWTPAAPCD